MKKEFVNLCYGFVYKMTNQKMNFNHFLKMLDAMQIASSFDGLCQFNLGDCEISFRTYFLEADDYRFSIIQRDINLMINIYSLSKNELPSIEITKIK